MCVCAEMPFLKSDDALFATAGHQDAHTHTHTHSQSLRTATLYGNEPLVMRSTSRGPSTFDIFFYNTSRSLLSRKHIQTPPGRPFKSLLPPPPFPLPLHSSHIGAFNYIYRCARITHTSLRAISDVTTTKMLARNDESAGLIASHEKSPTCVCLAVCR